MSIFSHSSENSLMFVLPYKFSISLSHIAELASLGILQSPRGLIEILPTLGPSGKQERLNCWLKKRRKKVESHFLMVSSSYVSLNVVLAK